MRFKVFVFSAFLTALVFTGATLPEDLFAGDKGGDYERFNWREKKDRNEIRPSDRSQKRNQDEVPENALFKEECSACHFLYQPWLLPSESWKIVMDRTEDHFGEDLAFEKEEFEEIRAYLVANGAEKSRAYNEWAGPAGKINRSLRGTVPESIREVPYIGGEHKGIRAKVFEREEIKTFSNCVACHKAAEKGNYSKAKVPGKDRKRKP